MVGFPASKLPSVPIDPQVFLYIPMYSYGCPGGVSQPPSYQVFLEIPRFSYKFLRIQWLPRWGFPVSKLPGILTDPQVFL